MGKYIVSLTGGQPIDLYKNFWLVALKQTGNIRGHCESKTVKELPCRRNLIWLKLASYDVNARQNKHTS